MAEAFTQLGFPAYFRVELALAKLLGVVLLLAPVPPRLKEWAYAGFAITLGSALIAHFSVGDGPESWGWPAATGVLWGLSFFFWRHVPGHAGERLTARSAGVNTVAGRTTKKPAAWKTAKKSAKIAKKAAATRAAAKAATPRKAVGKSSAQMSASARIDKRIADLSDWRGERLAEIRTLKAALRCAHTLSGHADDCRR